MSKIDEYIDEIMRLKEEENKIFRSMIDCLKEQNEDLTKVNRDLKELHHGIYPD
jgi:FtsZ-binding cell division protein ZapB